jgi:lipopolysaccharide/colanic/teichoic acid biosynthesis glycosyltransferase
LNLQIPECSRSELANLSVESEACSNFYARAGKRSLDVALSGIGLLLLSPILAIIALLVKTTSRGAVFFRQERVGKRGVRFDIVKFRTMIAGASSNGPAITVGGDLRVTRVGLVLRRYKLDEFPQLWNVLKGEMSLIGPRPEVPLYVALYTPLQMQVLSVRPGITDPTSLAYRHEEAVLARADDPEKYYREHLLPEKLALSLRYVGEISFRRDMLILYQTVAALLRDRNRNMPFRTRP